MVECQQAVISHYHQEDLGARVLAALGEVRGSLEDLTAEDLAPLDGLHVRGRRATAELAALAEVQFGERVLDIGAGLGGAARHLGAAYACRVVGLDLTPSYVALAADLTARVGLAEMARFLVGSATALPLGGGVFDLVWLEHVQMNIADKVRLVQEIARVLRPGGRLALYEVCSAGAAQPRFPVPWADTAATSFLLSTEGLRGLLVDNGLGVTRWRDVTEGACRWFRNRRGAGAAPPSPLGPHLLMGAGAGAKIANLGRSLEEGRVCLVQVVAERG
ncbi:MAG: methyltransferase domain-containing protein [Deferrisomatales bacterium]|nr:methyltransferase domain-containing protein [Deferrisomatales bacterium]